MSERITIQDIIDQLSEKRNLDRKDAELFVKGMFGVIEEALATDKYVKIKGLGTFKLIEVEKRESINVNTGERIEIQSHTKISFTPDNSMKDLINKPFAHFETVVLNENTKLEDLETEVEDNVEKIDEIQATPVDETTIGIDAAPEEKETTTEEMEATSKEKDITPEDKTEETIARAVSVEKMTDDTENVLPAEDTTVEKEQVTTSAPVIEEEQDEAKQQEKKPTNGWKVIIAIILALCMVGIICWYLQKDSHKPTSEQPSSTEITPNQEVEKPIAAAVTQDSDIQGKDVIGNTAVKETATAYKVTDPNAVTLSDTVEYDIIGTKASYILQEGESLVKVAVKFYGTKDLWPYIVKHNKSVIKNADRVPTGTTLLIPELTPKGQQN